MTIKAYTHLENEIRDGYSCVDIQDFFLQNSIEEMEIYNVDGTIEKTFVPSTFIYKSQELNEDTANLKFLFNERKIIDSGKPDNQSIVITIMGDGFTSAQQEDFIDIATGFVEHLLGNPLAGSEEFYPFNLFRDFFTVYAIEVISNEAGG